MAQPFDSKKGQLVGIARPVIDQVRQGGLLPIFAASLGNVLVYQPARGPATETQLAWFDRSTDDLRRPRFEVMSPVTHTFGRSERVGRYESRLRSECFYQVNNGLWWHGFRQILPYA